MKKSELKSYIKEEINNILSEVTVVDKNTKPEDIKDKDPLTVKKAVDTAKKSSKPVSIAEKEDDVEVEDDWYKSKDEDGDKDKEPSKADLKKQAAKTKGVVKAKDELAILTREMKSLAKKYKEAEGAEKDKIVSDLKAKTKLKKELEAILNK
jgi:aspartate oxidase